MAAPVDLYSWHDAVHEAREGARLQFWRFSFVPDYNQTAIFDAIRTVLEQNQLRSYIAYETLGEHDVMLRLWAPRDISPEDLALSFENALSHLSLYSHDYTVVHSTLLHWIWQSVGVESNSPRRPTSDDLARVTDAEVTELSQYNAATFSAYMDGDSPRMPPPPWIDDYITRDLIRPIPLGRRGMRFYLRFDHPRRPFRRPERDSVARQIAQILNDVANRTRIRLHLTEDVQLSLYVGSGPMTDFLILGRAPDGHFYSFVRDLIFRLLELELGRTYGMRTYTELFASRDFFDFREHPTSQFTPSHITLLDQPESEILEFKATLSLDVHRYLVTGERHENRAVTESSVKAICGLLNSPNGGRLVIGALEVERELERVPDRQATLEKLRAECPIYPPAPESDAGSNVLKALFGIEADQQDWDSFTLKLQDTLRSMITPSPLAFISIEPIQYQGRTLAVVTARPSSTWFYVRVKDSYEFYVRELASTRAYSGPEVDWYRRANPRREVEG